MPHPDQVFFSTSFFRAAWILCRSRWRPANDWLVSAAVALVSNDLLGDKLISIRGKTYRWIVRFNDAEQSGTIPFFSIPRRLWRTMRYRVEILTILYWYLIRDISCMRGSCFSTFYSTVGRIIELVRLYVWNMLTVCFIFQIELCFIFQIEYP